MRSQAHASSPPHKHSGWHPYLPSLPCCLLTFSPLLRPPASGSPWRRSVSVSGRRGERRRAAPRQAAGVDGERRPEAAQCMMGNSPVVAPLNWPWMRGPSTLPSAARASRQQQGRQCEGVHVAEYMVTSAGVARRRGWPKPSPLFAHARHRGAVQTPAERWGCLQCPLAAAARRRWSSVCGTHRQPLLRLQVRREDCGAEQGMERAAGG